VIVDFSEDRFFRSVHTIDREREFLFNRDNGDRRETELASARNCLLANRTTSYPTQHSSLYYTLSYYPSNIYSTLKHIVVTITSLGARRERVYIYINIYILYIYKIYKYIYFLYFTSTSSLFLLLFPLFSPSSLSLSSLFLSLLSPGCVGLYYIDCMWHAEGVYKYEIKMK